MASVSAVALTEPLARGVLIKRYKRFLADVALDDGTEMTVHCANSGSMLGMKDEGMPVVISDAQNATRKLSHTLELVRVNDGQGATWVGVHTGRPNAMVERAIRANQVPGLAMDVPLSREVPYASNSRIDLLARPADEADPLHYVEVKNTTLAQVASDGVLEARFPDAVTERGQKHLRDLMAEVDKGNQATLVFLVNRGDCMRFQPAAEIDPTYAALWAEARAAGVQMVPLQVAHRVTTRAGAVRAAWHARRILPVGCAQP